MQDDTAFLFTVPWEHAMGHGNTLHAMGTRYGPWEHDTGHRNTLHTMETHYGPWEHATGHGNTLRKSNFQPCMMENRRQTLFHTAQNCVLVYQRPANLTVVVKCKFCMNFNYWKSIWSLWGLTHSRFLFTVKGQWMVDKSCKQFSIIPDGFLCKMTECNNGQ